MCFVSDYMCCHFRQGPVKPDILSIQLSGRRSTRRLQRNNSLSPNNPLLSLVNSGGLAGLFSIFRANGMAKIHFFLFLFMLFNAEVHRKIHFFKPQQLKLYENKFKAFYNSSWLFLLSWQIHFHVNFTFFPAGVYDEDGLWTVQVNRLQKLIDRLEQKVIWPFSSTFFFYHCCLFFPLFLMSFCLTQLFILIILSTTSKLCI